MDNKVLENIHLVLRARWKHPDKYKRKVVVTDHGCSYYSIDFDKTFEKILQEVRSDLNLDENNQAIKKPIKKWWKFW